MMGDDRLHAYVLLLERKCPECDAPLLRRWIKMTRSHDVHVMAYYCTGGCGFEITEEMVNNGK